MSPRHRRRLEYSGNVAVSGVHELAEFSGTFGVTFDILDLSPLHRYRMDNVTTSGANLATVPNTGTAGGVLNVGSGTIAAPTTDAALNNREVVLLTGTQHLQPSLAAASFAFMNAGTGHDLFFLFKPTASVPPGALLSTYTGGAQTGIWLYENVAGSFRYVVLNASGAFVIDSAQAGGIVAGTPRLVEVTYLEGASPEFIRYMSGGLSEVTGNSAAAPSANTPAATLNIGRRANGTAYSQMAVAEVVIFDRVLTADERVSARAYFLERYALSA